MKVILLAHTQLSESFKDSISGFNAQDGQAVALTAIRTCYSHNTPSTIVEFEGERYFGRAAKDGEGGTETDRLIRHIVNSGHTSTLEHINYTFAIEGVSRSLLAQITRHRHFSFSVQSQRYNKLETGSKSGGFDYITPDYMYADQGLLDEYIGMMQTIQTWYDDLRDMGLPAEDARFILPNATTCNMALTGNLRSFLEFYGKRSEKGAQWEIRDLAELIKNEIVTVEPWTDSFFKNKS